MQSLEEIYNASQQSAAPQRSMEEIYNASQTPLQSEIPAAPKETPGFLKSAELIATGVDRGVSNFTLAMLSKLPFGNRWQNALKSVDASNEAAQQANIKKYDSILPQAGQIGGEILATLPLGGALGALGKGAIASGEAIKSIKGLGYAGKALEILGQGPSAIGAAMPTGLGTVAKYGSSAAGGLGLMAGMESQRYDPEHPGQLINEKAAAAALNNPYAALLPMAATKLGTWTRAAGALDEAKAIDPNAMARNLLPNDATRTASNMFFGIPAALTGLGKQAQQTRGIGDAINGFVQKTAGDLTDKSIVMNADKLTEYSANMVQNKLRQLSGIEDYMWNKGFKMVPISNMQGVKDEVVNAIDLLKTNKTPGWETSVNSLTNGIRKGKLTADDVKMLNTRISSAAISARGLEGGVGNELADQLGTVKDNLLNHIQNSLSPKEMADFSAARQLSADKFNLFSQAPKLQQAIYDEASAHQLIGTLTSEGGVLPPKRAALSILSPSEQNVIGATKVRQALESSDNGSGKINLDTFLKATGPNSQTSEILNKDAYNSLQGLNKYLTNVDTASKVGWWRQAAVGGTIASTAGVGAMLGGPLGAGAALASYAAMNLVANHSPLKTIFSALIKNLPDNTAKVLMKAAGKHLTRAGFLVTQDGVLQHKNEPETPQ